MPTAAMDRLFLHRCRRKEWWYPAGRWQALRLSTCSSASTSVRHLFPIASSHGACAVTADSCMASSFLASSVRLSKGFPVPADTEHESPETIKTVIDRCGSSFRCRRIWYNHDRWRPPWRTSMPSGSQSRPQRFEAHRYGCGYRSDPRCVPADGQVTADTSARVMECSGLKVPSA